MFVVPVGRSPVWQVGSHYCTNVSFGGYSVGLHIIASGLHKH